MTEEINLTYLIIVFSSSFFIVAIIFFLTLSHVYKQNMARERGIRLAIYSTQEKERSRISVELHDNIGTKLTAIKLFSESLMNSENKKPIIDEIITTTKETIIELRTIITNTSGDHILINGLNYELNKLIKQISKLNINLKMQFFPDFLDFKNQFGVNLYRIIQELINNSIKHSGCDIIKIELIELNNKIQLSYFDNGIGFDITALNEQGMGLKNIESRIFMFNGNYKRFLSTFEIEFPINHFAIKDEHKN